MLHLILSSAHQQLPKHRSPVLFTLIFWNYGPYVLSMTIFVCRNMYDKQIYSSLSTCNYNRSPSLNASSSAVCPGHTSWFPSYYYYRHQLISFHSSFWPPVYSTLMCCDRIGWRLYNWYHVMDKDFVVLAGCRRLKCMIYPYRAGGHI